jgi:hypothetical protein
LFHFGKIDRSWFSIGAQEMGNNSLHQYATNN